MIGLKKLPYESRGARRLAAATKLLERHIEKLYKDLETPTERLIINHPDLCIWMFRKFKIMTRRYVKVGAPRGIRILQLGWVLLSFRY